MVDNKQEKTLHLTYTCPVSRFTYAGHPSRGYLYEHTNDLRDAVTRIKTIAGRHGQPVSWVINDQEYLNLEGLLPDLLEYQRGGDSILVTMELTTSPEGVDKTDAGAVLRWIAARCSEAGLVPDGLWSLKFFETDLAAILELPSDDFPWTRNLAGSCWHQEGIDDSTWLGCPFNPYFVAPWNARAAAQQDDPQQLLMLEWLTRDIQACLSGGFPATFSLDPADTNRSDAGGFGNEQDALRYSIALINETARQIAFNECVVVNINEEARHYQSEGHDKDFMLDGMFGRFAEIAANPPEGVAVRQAPYAEVWRYYRARFSHTPSTLWTAADLDWRPEPPEGVSDAYANRIRGDQALLYQDQKCQMGFLRSRGVLPLEFYDYSARVPGNNSNDPYPHTQMPPLELHERTMDVDRGQFSLSLTIRAPQDIPQAGMVLWDAPVRGDEKLIEQEGAVGAARATPAGLFLKLRMSEGINHYRIVMSRGE